jgi:hypothetical protein
MAIEKKTRFLCVERRQKICSTGVERLKLIFFILMKTNNKTDITTHAYTTLRKV